LMMADPDSKLGPREVARGEDKMRKDRKGWVRGGRIEQGIEKIK
jgi:hypothetical protein